MSSTPIIDFLKEYAEKNTVRAHMPGHKGAVPGFLSEAAKYDITEIPGADELFCARGVIRESEENAARLFGAGRTLYSTEGSSLAIRAMLYLALINAKALERAGFRPKTERYTVLAARNAHFAFIAACAALDLDIEWLMPESCALLSCPVTARMADEALAALDERKTPPILVYVTSPDYLGAEQPIAELALAAHWHGVPFAVDNAHGAYLGFVENDRHPMKLGADLCCDSAHKTLSCLTGAAYLHISKYAPAVMAETAERALALFASTSPSYLILASLDAMNARLENGCREELAAFSAELSLLKKRLEAEGFSLVGTEELKLTLAPKSCGYTGLELAETLRKRGVECEYADEEHTVLMLSAQNGEEALRRIEAALLPLERRAPLEKKDLRLPKLTRVMTVREAMLAPQEFVPTERAVGWVMGNDHCACPPAVPPAIPGELITREAAELMIAFLKTECAVVNG